MKKLVCIIVLSIAFISGCTNTKSSYPRSPEQTARLEAKAAKDKIDITRAHRAAGMTFKETQQKNTATLAAYHICVGRIIKKGIASNWPKWRIAEKSVPLCRSEYLESTWAFIDYRYFDKTPSYRKQMYGYLEDNDKEAAEVTVDTLLNEIKKRR